MINMAHKRKSFARTDAVSRKKICAVDSQDTPDLDWDSEESGDYKVNFTDNGTKRAESEARRQWNYVCEVGGCGQRFNRPCRLEAHMRSHTKERPFVCPEEGCDKTFPRKDHLQRHLKNAHSDGDSERTFICDWEGCGKSFTSNGRLQRHRDVHESKFYCTGYPPCNESFRKDKALVAHIKSQHLEVKPYACIHVDQETGERCLHGYQTEGALRRHIVKVHGGSGENEHLCMICIPPGTEAESLETETGDVILIPKEPLSFATNEELIAHSHEFHPPVCSQCGLKFKHQYTLKSHYDTVHADRKNQPQFPCPKPGCDSVFNRKHNLNVHIQTVHEKRFRYFCATEAMQSSKHEDLKGWDGKNACGAAFKAKSSLDQHIRTHHLGLGNRKQARKAAKSKKKPEPSTLTLLTGIGYEKGRDIPCLVKTCEYRFYRNCDLRRHLRAAHSLPDEDIADMIRERDALAGGQFWVGGLDESLDLFDDTPSVQPSVPQTPHPYFSEQNLRMPISLDGYNKPLDPQLGGFDQDFDHLSLFNAAESELDMAMGLGDLPTAVDAQEELQWDMLAPVEMYTNPNTFKS